MNLRAITAVFFILILSCLSSEAAEARRAGYVVIVSFDQTAPFNVEAARMPRYKKMAAEGAHTWEAYTIVPSITLPSHASMVTGVGIQKHQVDWNDANPSKGTVKVPTIFSLAKQAGLKTALYASKEKFQTLNIPGSLDKIESLQSAKSLDIAKAFAADFTTLKPNVTLVHFGEPDATGHAFGVRSAEKMKALEEADDALGVMVDTIEKAGVLDQCIIILTSDHGGHDEIKDGKPAGKHGSSSPDDVTIPWIVWGTGVKKGFTITAAVVTYDTAATALWLLGLPIPESFWGRPVVSAFQ